MQELLEVKDLYEQKYGFPVEHETEELQESRCDSHPHVLQHRSEFVTRNKTEMVRGHYGELSMEPMCPLTAG